ncbi:MAG: hypothetical protein M0022_04790 [Desulfobacteraceae bacterium]|nr:hypothetical protein [Desulfobacteraceae bacterium]
MAELSIVQQFLIMIEDGEFDEGEKVPAVDFRKDVSDPLKVAGYRVLASTEWTNGVPHYFFVEGPMSLNGTTIKERVYDLLKQCDLRAMSGEAFLEL